VKRAQGVLQQMKVFSFDQVLALLNCSIRTGRSQLKQWGIYRSYNHNGRYYAMPCVPCFDEHGLWRCHNIYFSRYGNLKKTIVRLVNDSPSGLTGKQLGHLLGLSPQSFLHHFRDAPGICREKHGGLYVYFSDRPVTRTAQVQQRLQVERLPAPSLSDTDAVMILVAILKHHDSAIEDIMAVPEIQEQKWPADVIREFLHRHGLLKKLRLHGIETAHEMY
jgi:hypothetical protein